MADLTKTQICHLETVLQHIRLALAENTGNKSCYDIHCAQDELNRFLELHAKFNGGN